MKNQDMDERVDGMMEKGEMDNGQLRLLAQPEDEQRERNATPTNTRGGSRVLNTLAVIASALRPGILRRTPKHTQTPKLRRTAYLDGLRGFAAFLVYLLHHELWAHSWEGSDILENAWGWDGKYFLAALPGIRVFFGSGGHLAVSTFFVISGYVLTAKPLSLIQSGDHLKLSENVASALFRRWLRLFIPIWIVTLMIISVPHVFGIKCGFNNVDSFGEELWNWYAAMKNFTYIFNNTLLVDYHPHTWSIPIEMKGSIVVYTTAMAFSRCTRNARLWCECGLIFYFMYIVDGAHMAMFVAGMLLSDLDLLALNDDLPAWMYRLKPHKTKLAYAVFIIGLYLGGVPANSSDIMHLRASKGWYYLSFFKPQAVFDFKWFFLFWGAVSMVISAQHVPFLKRFFESRFCLYLGRISFMFYLFHGPVLWILGDRIYGAVGYVTEKRMLEIPTWVNLFPVTNWGVYALEVRYLLPHLILLPVTFWVAELGTTFIDTPCNDFAQWVYRKTLPASSDRDRQNERSKNSP
ncbi:related to hard surface induced protein 3 (sterol glycosyl transferase) [Ramularia collo-cygni]|uniref:Related to hard surface induced protein 3 (Sterol glycosyl transferase) n=1 Tax=Ramularia collo-cygni TaxID=112498 RepID=A0A2D3UWH1_9PEZI|nr:related to hard surface induced protein 3 (sterol glycosyl transferase) [Ramularia collo-cygni]CZT14404.1 related to hard surface induced protein 3 (sterol glycosyl transferase) [Ramularia collo-cygni]